MKASDLINTVNMILMQQERKQTQREKETKASFRERTELYIQCKNDADAAKSPE